MAVIASHCIEIKVCWLRASCVAPILIKEIAIQTRGTVWIRQASALQAQGVAGFADKSSSVFEGRLGAIDEALSIAETIIEEELVAAGENALLAHKGTFEVSAARRAGEVAGEAIPVEWIEEVWDSRNSLAVLIASAVVKVVSWKAFRAGLRRVNAVFTKIRGVADSAG